MRPTTLTTNMALTTETTLRTMCTLHFSHQEEDNEEMYMEPHSIIQNTAMAARANLNYVKINDQLSNVLQDVDDIMTQQVSDVFQLSSWLSSVISLFRLKICDKQEWQNFNRHYNRKTGEITAFSPYETTSTPHDIPMTDVARDELSKTCEELATANTTIKNPSKPGVTSSP